MQVSSVNNNYDSASFGATIRFADRSAKKRLASTSNFETANKLLDQLENMHKDVEITIGARIDEKLGPILYAINSKTGYEARKQTTMTNYDDKIGNSSSFYELIQDITTPTLMLYRDFWLANPYEMPKVNPDKYKGIKHYEDPTTHSIFVN